MRYHEVKNTIYGKKMMFNALLFKELSDCKYKVNACYEWRQPDRILSLRFSEEQVIQLEINLNIGKEKIFHNNDRIVELSIKYRAYYISSYIRCLETALTVNPQSYFSGIVLLCAINDLCSKEKIVSFSPIVNKRLPRLRPIDIHCAILALTRVTVDCGAVLSSVEKNECDNVINNLLTYSILPEIEYKRANTVYSLLNEIKEFQRNTVMKRRSISVFPLFGKNGIKFLGKMMLDDLVEICDQVQNPFWTGLTMRLIAYTESKWQCETNHIVYLKDCVFQYEEASVRYFVNIQNTTDILLIDNYTAIRRNARKFERVFSADFVNSGVLHYYQ